MEKNRAVNRVASLNCTFLNFAPQYIPLPLLKLPTFGWSFMLYLKGYVGHFTNNLVKKISMMTWTQKIVAIYIFVNKLEVNP